MFNKEDAKITLRAVNLLLSFKDKLEEEDLRRAKQSKEFLEAYINGDVILDPWTTDDVKSLTDDDDTEDLTDEIARQVLASVDENHDSEIGINWEVLRENLDIVLGR